MMGIKLAFIRRLASVLALGVPQPSPPPRIKVLQIAENRYLTGPIGPGLQQDFQEFRTSFQERDVVSGLGGGLPAACVLITLFMKAVTLEKVFQPWLCLRLFYWIVAPPQHRLYFFPEPHGQEAFRPIFRGDWNGMAEGMRASPFWVSRKYR